MQEFRYLSYHTCYSSSGTFNFKYSKNVCFSAAFRAATDYSDNTYQIKIYMGTKASKETQVSNACLFNLRQIRNHLKQVREIYPFTYSIKNNYVRIGEDDRFPAILLTLHVKDVPANFHKYLLTWVRYLYEYPFNVLLADVYKLKNTEPRFRFTSISDLMNVAMTTYQDEIGGGHSICNTNIHELLKKADIRERIKKVHELNKIYKERIGEVSTFPKYIGNYRTCDIEYWESEEAFNLRKAAYLDTYKSTLKK